MANASMALTKKHFYLEVVQEVKLEELQGFLEEIGELYPEFEGWLRFKFHKNLVDRNGTRSLLVARKGYEWLGVALLKHDSIESKICTFYVAPDHRGNGVGQSLMRAALDRLDSDRTVITVSEQRFGELNSFLLATGFRLEDSVQGMYWPDKTEYIFSL